MAKADEEQARASVQTVGLQGLLHDEIKRVGGATKFKFKYHVESSGIEKEPTESNNNNFFIRSMEERRRVVRPLSDSGSSENSYQSDFSDNDGEALKQVIQRKKRKVSVEKGERETTEPPALIASEAINDRLSSATSTIVLPEASSTLVSDTNSVLRSRSEGELRSKLLLNNQSGKVSEGELLTTTDLVAQSYSENKGIKQPFLISQGNVAVLAQSLAKNVFTSALPDDVTVSSKQPLSQGMQQGMVIKVN